MINKLPYTNKLNIIIGDILGDSTAEAILNNEI